MGGYVRSKNYIAGYSVRLSIDQIAHVAIEWLAAESEESTKTWRETFTEDWPKWNKKERCQHNCE